MRFGFSQIWRWPIILAILMMFGLLSALIGQGGVWWVLSWIAMVIPLLVIAASWQKRRRPASEQQ
jgi:hypothetical protein